MREFLSRVWRQDVAPLLRDRRRAAERRSTARVTGKIGAGFGLFLDTVLGLKGRPFTRSLTVLGGSWGAMLPDVWDWRWFHSGDRATQRQVTDQMQRRAAELSDQEALDLFDLPASATREDLRSAWRSISLRWHPDRAVGAEQRAEFHLRFVTYQASYDRLVEAYEQKRLPRAQAASHGG